jgi:membrane-associated phospholipid phosphatase
MKYSLGIPAGQSDAVAAAIKDNKALPPGCEALVSPFGGKSNAKANAAAAAFAFPALDTDAFWEQVKEFSYLNQSLGRQPVKLQNYGFVTLAMQAVPLPGCFNTPIKVGVSTIDQPLGTTLETAAAWVKDDFPAQAGVWAVEYLVRQGVKFRKPPAVGTVNFVPARFDATTDICEAVAEACLATWWLKWTAMAPRPIEVATAIREGRLTIPANWINDPDVDWFANHFLPSYIKTPKHPSWPSGHAAHGAAISKSLIATFEKDNELVAKEALSIKVWLGCGRILGGIHWPIDIQAGWAAADAL